MLEKSVEDRTWVWILVSKFFLNSFKRQGSKAIGLYLSGDFFGLLLPLCMGTIMSFFLRILDLANFDIVELNK